MTIAVDKCMSELSVCALLVIVYKTIRLDDLGESTHKHLGETVRSKDWTELTSVNIMYI